MSMRSCLAGLVVAVAVSGCGAAPDDEERTSTDVQGLTAPGPILWPYNGDGEPNWDGSLVELMMADAYAFCVPEWRTMDDDTQTTTEGDRQLAAVIAAMDKSTDESCWGGGPLVSDSAPYKWAWLRTQTDCNRVNNDDESVISGFAGLSGRLSGPDLDSAAMATRWAPYDIDTPYTNVTKPGDLTGLTHAGGSAVDRDNAVAEAQAELVFAGTNVCMASRLREQMLTADVLILSDVEQQELLEAIRQRAQIAMLQFSLLGLAFTNTGTTNVDHELDILPVLLTYANALDTSYSARWEALARDYATAVRLHVDASSELANLFVRSAAAHSDLSHLGGDGKDAEFTPSEEWGHASWRGRLRNLLYSGDPLGSPWSGLGTGYNTPEGHKAGTIVGRALPTEVSSSGAEEPEVQTLLDLARRHDAIYLRTDDLTLAGNFIYTAVEAGLQERVCLLQDPTATCDIKPDDTTWVQPVSDYELTALWNLFRITPEHARKLAVLLDGALNGIQVDEFTAWGTDGIAAGPMWTGRRPTGSIAVEAPDLLSPPMGVTWLHADPSFTLEEWPIAVDASFYQRNVNFYMPPGGTLVMNQPGVAQGFVGRQRRFNQLYSTQSLDVQTIKGLDNEAMRFLGSVPALTAARFALHDAFDAHGGTADKYFRFAPEIEELIRGAVGEVSVSLRPVSEEGSNSGWGCTELGLSTPCTVITQEHGTSPSHDLKFDVHVLVPNGQSVGDSLIVADWEWMTNSASTNDIANDLRHIVPAASDTTFVADVATDAFGAAELDSIETGTYVLTSTHTDVLGADHHHAKVELDMYPDDTACSAETGPCQYQASPTLMLRHDGTPRDDYDILATRVWVGSIVDDVTGDHYGGTSGAYLSTGGTLTEIAAGAVARQDLYWGKPYFDGFNLAHDWIPPVNPDLFGGASGEDSLSYYLRNAEEAADDATAAVRQALETLIEEEIDEQKRAASAARAATITDLETQALCGQGACDTTLVNLALPVTLDCLLPSAQEACAFVESFLEDASPEDPIEVLKPVSDADPFGDTFAPPFSEFQGGELQRLAIAQFNALQAYSRLLADGAKELEALALQADAARSQAEAAEDAWEIANDIEQADRDFRRSQMKLACTLSPRLEKLKSKKKCRKKKGLPKSKRRCKRGRAGLQAEHDALAHQFGQDCLGAARAVSEAYGAPGAGTNRSAVLAARDQATAQEEQMFVGARSLITRLLAAAATAEQATADIHAAIEQTGIRKARVAADLEAEQSGFVTTLPLFDNYHRYDMWRARALLENARRLANAARRGIESRFNVDLDEMHEDEPFVAAPSSWVDEVYEYDLSPPSAVGLQRTPSPDGLYANKLSDYVTNLKNFVAGYAVLRPTAVALGDTEVLSLPGPDRSNIPAGQSESVFDFRSAGWLFQCDGSEEWLTNPSAAPAGGSRLKWTFGESAAPFASEGYGEPASFTVASGTFSAPVPAPGGYAVDFDGSSSLTTGATEAGEGEVLSAFAWINPSSLTSDRAVLARPHSPTTWITPATSFQLRIFNNQFAVHLTLAGTQHNLYDLATIPTDTWSQIGMTFDGWKVRVYVDGVLQSEHELVAATLPAVPIDWGTHGPWVLGDRSTVSPGAKFQGLIGETVVDSVVWSDQQIADQYAKTALETKPSVRWQFGESAAPFANSGSGGALPLDVATGSVTVSDDELVGRALDLDGSTSLETAATTEGQSPNEITVSAWLYLRATSAANSRIIAKNYHASTWATPFTSVSLYEHSGKLRGMLESDVASGLATSNFDIPLNQWSHVALTYDGDDIKLYIDGVEAKTAGTPSGAIDWGEDGAWWVGGNPLNTGEELDGIVADVKVFPIAHTGDYMAQVFSRRIAQSCYQDIACVAYDDCCEGITASPLSTLCAGAPPARAKIEFSLDPWGRINNYYANPPFNQRHNARWGRMAVNLVGTGIRNCAAASDRDLCFAESFLRYDFSHNGPAWCTNYDGQWRPYAIPTAFVESGKALATEEWLDPIINGWNQTFVQSVQRHELRERPLGGSYELELEVGPEVRLDRIQQVQILTESDYWVSQQY